jgi:cold shock CspA family protein
MLARAKTAYLPVTVSLFFISTHVSQTPEAPVFFRSPDVFAHSKAIVGDGYRFLTEGQRVHYTVTQGEKGLQAEQITPVT